jgi:hypothetical protein
MISRLVLSSVMSFFLLSKGFVAAWTITAPGWHETGKFAVGHRSNCILHMAVTPIGPFCPFRSSAAVSMEPKMEAMSAAGPKLHEDIARVQLDMQTGQMPDPERLIKVAEGLEAAVHQWETLHARLRLSQDFQTREFGKLTQAHLEAYGVTVTGLVAMMRWQSGCMKAMARNTPPPMPPRELDLAKMMAQDSNRKPAPSVAAMTAAEKINRPPFSPNSKVFDSPNVKGEYEALCRDHMALVEFGGNYETFDPLGKLRYLDEVEKIEERWDIFFARFKLLGELDAAYIDQCNEFLASMGMTEDDYRKLLKKCHQIMREEAEIERNR